MNEIKVSYKMRFKDLYLFSLRQALTGLNGCAYWLVLGLLVWRLITGFSSESQNMKILLIGALVLMVVVMPANLALRTAQSVRLAAQYQLENRYTFSEEGILVEQGEEQELLGWDKIRKVRLGRSRIILYVTKNSAFLLPKDVVGEEWDALCTMVKACCGK